MMVQVACEQAYLGSAPPLEQLEQLEQHSLQETPLCGVRTTPANLLLAPDLCIALTVLDLGINHWTSMYTSLRVFGDHSLSFIYDTVVVLLDLIKMFGRGLLLQMQEGQTNCPEL